MFAIKSILVAIDDSPSSKSALSVACEIGRKAGAKVKGLYVEDMARLLEWQPVALLGSAIAATNTVPQPLPTQEQLEVEKEFLEERNAIKKHFDHSCSNSKLKEFTLDTKRGRVDEVIVEAAKTVDLVVLGKRGKTYPEESKDPGPTTENVVRSTIKPVIVVPEKAKRTTRILIAYDGSTTSQRALEHGAIFASLQASEVEILSVFRDPKVAEKHLNDASDFLSNYGIKTNHLKGDYERHPWKSIIDHAREFNAGLIVIGSFGDNKLMELVFGSTTHNVLVHTPCPVLLCR